MKDLAVNYFKEGNSCSESIVKAAIDKGLCHDALLNSATAFSGGMSVGCVCGAVAGSQIVIGAVFPRNRVRLKASEFLIEFKKKHSATCCKVLSKGLEGAEKRQNCLSLVSDCAEILYAMIEEKALNV